MNWETINSFSGWAAAAGTFFAAVVALQIASRDREIRLRVHPMVGTYVDGPVIDKSKKVVSITVTNGSMLPVTIDAIAWRCRAPWHLRFLLKKSETFGGFWLQEPSPFMGSDRFPKRLAYGESFHLVIPAEVFSYTWHNQVNRSFSGLFGRWALTRLRLVIVPSFGDEVTADIGPSIRRVLSDLRGTESPPMSDQLRQYQQSILQQSPPPRE